MKNRTKATVELTTQENVGRGLRIAAAKFERFEASVKKSLGRSLMRLPKVAAGVTAIGLAAATAFGADSIRKFSQFEASMKGVEAVLKPTTKEFNALEAEAKRLGRTTRFSAREAASGIEILAKNGVKTEKILGGMLESSLMLSASLGADLAESADVLTDAMSVFNLEASKAKGVVDSINAVAINSKFGFEDYANALASGGASAVAAGQSIEEFNNTITATASFFDSGETAGTAYKVFIDRLVPASDAAAIASKKLGLSVFKSNGELKDMSVIAGQLQRGLEGLTEEERIKALNDLFGTRGKNFAVALARAGEEGIRSAQFLSQFADAAAQAEKRLEGTQGAATKFASAFEGLQIAIGEPLAEAATPFIEAFAASISDFTEDVEGSQSVIAEFFAGIIVNSAKAIDLIRTTIDSVRGLVADFQIGMASIKGDDEEASRLATEEVIRSRQFDEAKYTKAANQIVARAEELRVASAAFRDEEAKFLALVKVRKQADAVGATKEELMALEKAIVGQDRVVKAQRQRINQLKGLNAEEESEQDRAIKARLSLSAQANEALEKAADLEQRLRAARGRLSTLRREEGLGILDEASNAATINQEKIVEALRKSFLEAQKFADEMVASEKKSSEAAKITVERFKTLAVEAGISSDNIVTSLKLMSEEGGLSLDRLGRDLDNLQRKLGETTKSGETFHDKATKNSWLKDFALEGIGFLQDLVKKGIDPLQSKLSTVTAAGTMMAGAAVGAMQSGLARESKAAEIVGNYDQGQPFSRFGGFGFDSAQPLPGQADLALVEKQHADKMALLRQHGLEETEVARQQELQKLEALGQIRQMQIAGVASGFDAMLQLTEAFGGKQSSAFKALFAISKGFAIAESVIAIQTAIAKASAIGFPANIPLIAQAISQGAQIVSTIKGTQPSFLGGGYTGNGARTGGVDGRGGYNAIVHPGEYVYDQRQGQSPGATVHQTIHIYGDPNPAVVEEIKAAASQKALSDLADTHNRRGARSASLSRIR